MPATLSASGLAPTDASGPQEELGPQQGRSRPSGTLFAIGAVTETEWEILLRLWDRLERAVSRFCQRAEAQGRVADFDTVFDWALDYALHQIKVLFRISSEPERVYAIANSVLWRRLGPELSRKLSRKRRQRDLEDQLCLKPTGSLEAVVSELQLKPDQTDLLLKVLYKRNGERLSSLFSGGAEKVQWFRLRQQLATQLGGVQ